MFTKIKLIKLGRNYLAALSKVANSRSRTFLGCLIFFMLGVASAEVFTINSFYIFCLLLLAIFLLFIYVRWPVGRFLCLMSIFILLGFWRYQISQIDFSNPGRIGHYQEIKTTFQGVVVAVDRRLDKQKLTIATEEIYFNSGSKKISGLVWVTAGLYPIYEYGDELKINCKFIRPQKNMDFDYEKYMARYNVEASCGWPGIEKIASGRGQVWLSLIGRLKSQLLSSLSAAVSEPAAAIVKAMVLGERGGMSAEQLDQFSKVGISHIIAISGMNVAIIVVALMELAMVIGLARPKAFWLATSGTVIFILMIGDQASAVRAAIMALLFLYAKKIGRPSSAFNVIIFAAAVMILFNPRLLLSDVGFQLSFVAVLGMVYLEPLVTKKLHKIFVYEPIREMAAITLAAQVATLPLILFYFHQLSLVAVVANLLVLPVASFLTIWGLVNALVGLTSVWLGQLLGYVSWLAGSYILLVAKILVRLPGAYVSINFFNIFWLVICYLVIIWWVRQKKLSTVSTIDIK